MTSDGAICIVDDDESVRESLTGFLRSLGMEAQPFASAEAFLAGCDEANTACVVVDVMMPGMTGVELQEHLQTSGKALPLIFITARSEENLRRRVMERGAIAWLVKPFPEDDLLRAVQSAKDASQGSL